MQYTEIKGLLHKLVQQPFFTVKCCKQPKFFSVRWSKNSGLGIEMPKNL